MKQIFSIKSPIWQILAATLLYVVVLLITYDKQHSPAEGFTPARIGLFVAAALAILYSIIYTTAISRYNKRNPHDTLSITGVKPAELRDEDEGMRMITARATERVYRYHSFALPLSMVFIALSDASAYGVSTILFLLTLGHYLTYWRGIWPAFGEAAEE